MKLAFGGHDTLRWCILQVEYIRNHSGVEKQYNRRRDEESKYNEAAVLFRQTMKAAAGSREHGGQAK